MLGSDGITPWKQTEEGLSVSLPSKPVSAYANTLRIECDGKSLDNAFNQIK
jgi:hypothetical protein